MREKRRARILVLGLLIFLLTGSGLETPNAQSSDKGARRGQTGKESRSASAASDRVDGAPGRTLHALIIGINHFQDGKIRELCYCRSDAEALHALLTDRRFIPFDKADVRLLVDENATARKVKEELHAIGRAAATEDTVVVYFSSHGMQQDGSRCFWVLNDTQVDPNAYDRRELRLLPQTALEQPEISRLLRAIRAKRIVVLVDCCFSAATVISHTRGEEFRSPPTQNPFESFKGEGMVVLTSSKGTELSSELRQLKHGAFTYYLLDGLRGAADVNSDNVVELWEIWQYLGRKVTEAAKSQGNDQNPTISASALTHDFPLTTYPVTSVVMRPTDAVTPAPTPVHVSPDQKTTNQVIASLQLKWVTVSTRRRTIQVSSTEITNRQFLEFIRANRNWAKGQISPSYHDGDYLLNWPTPDQYPEGLDDHPVTRVSWFAAKAFAEWVGARLPSESEWIIAATGAAGAERVSSTSTPQLYPWGKDWDPGLCNSLDGKGRLSSQVAAKTERVGSFESGASIWGQSRILDMAGNIWEWCDDWVFEKYGTKAIGVVGTGPVGADANPEIARLIKGGSYLADRVGCMIASRTWANPRLCAEDGGFRVVRE